MTITPSVILAVLTEPVNVHVTQDNGGLEPLFVPLAVVLAGILAALFSWWTTNRTLRHDRQVREREATSKALDGVVDAINIAAGVLNRAGEVSGELERVIFEKQPRRDLDDRLRTSAEELKALNIRLMGAAFRLLIRFPDDHPISRTFATWQVGIEQLADQYQALVDSPPQKVEEFRLAHENHDRLGGQLHKFLTAARQWATAHEQDDQIPI